VNDHLRCRPVGEFGGVKFGLVREVFQPGGHAAERLTPKSVCPPEAANRFHEVPADEPGDPVIRMRMTRSREFKVQKEKFKDEGNPIRSSDLCTFHFELLQIPTALKSGVAAAPGTSGRDSAFTIARRVA